jgi:hypothetical protein
MIVRQMTRRGVVGAGVAAAAAACSPRAQSAAPEAGLPRMNHRRACHAAVRAAGGVLLIGGFDAEGRGLASVERFDPATRRFDLVAALTQARLQPLAAVLADGRTLVVGGEWRGESSTAEIFDGESFRPLGATHSSRNAAAAAVLADGRVLVCGGEEPGRRLVKTAEIFDPSTNRFSRLPDMAAARAGHTATLLPGGEVLVAGGGLEGSVIADAELFDPAEDRFRRLDPLARARFKHGAAPLPNGDVLIVGGSNPSGGDDRGRLDHCERFDSARMAFVEGPPLATPRYKLHTSTVTLADGSIVAAGGGLRPEVLRPGAARFEALAHAFDSRRDFMAAAPLDDRRFLVTGGYDENIETTARAWIASV